jgi:GNAT superfamily N-acetyltransferase
MTINIRLATLDDIPLIQKLIVDSVRRLSASYYSEEQITSALAYIFGVDTQLILDGTYFVAEDDGEIVGAGGWSKRATMYGGDQLKSGDPDPLLSPGSDPARVRAFYVHPEAARKGIARRILTACEAALKQEGFTRIELVATLPGEPLYSALGYDIINPVEMTMPDGQSISGFLMEKIVATTTSQAAKP